LVESIFDEAARRGTDAGRGARTATSTRIATNARLAARDDHGVQRVVTTMAAIVTRSTRRSPRPTRGNDEARCAVGLASLSTPRSSNACTLHAPSALFAKHRRAGVAGLSDRGEAIGDAAVAVVEAYAEHTQLFVASSVGAVLSLRRWPSASAVLTLHRSPVGSSPALPSVEASLAFGERPHGRNTVEERITVRVVREGRHTPPFDR
jgi:hypothetical protein